LKVRLEKLKPHIIGGTFIQIRSATFSDDGSVYLDAESDHGMIVIPISKEGFANVLLGLPSLPPKKALVPKAIAAALERKSAAKSTASKKSRVLKVGQTRSHNGKRQRLESFTDSGSVQEKPPGVQRRTRHPDTGAMVWPVWGDA